jgi:small subunit ribosomal protein S4
VVNNVASTTLKPGDLVSVRGKSQAMDVVLDSIQVNASNVKKFAWLEWNDSKLEGTFIQYPTRDQIPENINEQLIVELYSK